MKLFAVLILIFTFLTVVGAQITENNDSVPKTVTTSIARGAVVHVSSGRPDRLHWEPVIASDPENPKNLLACWIDGEQGSKPEGFIVVYSSFDGGRSWRKTLEIPHPDGNVSVAVDPACAFGPGGAAYASALVRGKPIYRSTDSGKTWKKVIELGIRGWDREYLTADNTKSKNRGRVYFHYMGWIAGVEDGDAVFGIDIWHSDDLGLRFKGPAKLISKKASEGGPNMGNGTVLSDGTFLAILAESSLADDNDRIVIVKPGDDKTFSSAITVSNWKPVIGDREFNVCGALPVVAADTSPGKFNDRLYVVWPDRRTGTADIMISTSSDKGKTWSAPRVLNNDVPNDGSPDVRNCTPGIAVNSAGVVGVIWYNARKEPNSDEYHYQTRFSASLDGGETFLPSIKLSDDRTFPKKFRIGETIGLTAGPDGKFHALWVENRTGVPQIYYAPITANGSTIQTAASNGLNLDKELKEKIYNEEIKPLLSKADPVPDWVALEKRLVRQYGPVGRELVWKVKPRFYLRTNDPKNLQTSLSQYIRKYGTGDLTPTQLNDYAWALFENFPDKKILEQAAAWSFESMQKLKQWPEAPDTYANILYRLGRTKEAIEWEEKARDLAKSEDVKKRFQATIDKMKKGEPTWPVK